MGKERDYKKLHVVVSVLVTFISLLPPFSILVYLLLFCAGVSIYTVTSVTCVIDTASIPLTQNSRKVRGENVKCRDLSVEL